MLMQGNAVWQLLHDLLGLQWRVAARGHVAKVNANALLLFSHFPIYVQPGADSQHPLWRSIPTLGGPKIWYNPYTGALSPHGYPAPPPVQGGILADEMGLGKTVEILGLIQANPCPRELLVPDEVSGVCRVWTHSLTGILLLCN